MTRLEDLQKAFTKNEMTLANAKEKYSTERDRVLREVVALAKFKVGNRVIVTNSREVETMGIIREIKGVARFSDDVYPQYVVGKITKSGAIHKNQNLNYWAYREDELQLVGKNE